MRAKLEILKDGELIDSFDLYYFKTDEWVDQRVRMFGVTLEQCTMVVNKDGTRVRIRSLSDVIWE